MKQVTFKPDEEKAEMKLSEESAVKLYEILDENIGVFKPKNILKASEKEKEFYTSKKTDFVKTFSTKIPEKFWFQGGYHSSVTLLCDTTGLHLEISPENHNNTNEACKKVNRLIKNEAFILT